MRIIGGIHRSRKLLAPRDSTITRPITDRVKEALFNILSIDIDGSIFLDLFGGTGSVGIEALSRGAAFVRFVEINQSAVKTLSANLERSHLKELAEILHRDAFSMLAQPPDRAFDYIFIAPPQYKELWIKTMQVLEANPTWLSPDGWIIVQIDPVEYEELPMTHFKEIEQRKYGSTLLLFYEHNLQTP
jgi:16S rRNA (guanine(966)-N(2))-methyltransferase RsmD